MSKQEGREPEKSRVSRRGFLKAGSVAVGTVVLGGIAGCGDNVTKIVKTADTTSSTSTGYSFETAPAAITNIKSTVETDVVIVGAGDAGFAASLAAAKGGAKVVLLEKLKTYNPHGFGNGAIGTKFQTAQGITLDKGEIINLLMRWSSNKADQQVLNLWADNSGRVYDYICDLATAAGLPIWMLSKTPTNDPWYPEFPTCLVFGTKMNQGELYGVLEPEAIKLGVDIRYQTPAQQLVRDSSGRVTAVIAQAADGTYIKFTAKKGVILATGDYGNNTEMMAKWGSLATGVDANLYTGANNTGDGHKMGLWVGGAIEDGPHAPMIHTLGGATMSMNPVLRVNMLGERYENEDVPNPYICNSRLRSPGNKVWAVFDSKWATEVSKTTPGFGRTTSASASTISGMADAVTAGTVLKADTIGALAAAMGVPAATFQATVNRYTQLAASGVDSDFGKAAANLWTIEQGPFYATKVWACLLVMLGGFKVNAKLQVLDKDGKVVTGLYAAGNVSGGFYANDYPVLAAGLSHGRSITEGYLAGEYLAANG